MNMTTLQDSITHLTSISQDLRAIHTLLAVIDGEEVLSCEGETLMVVLRALQPIISDLEEVTACLGTEPETN